MLVALHEYKCPCCDGAIEFDTQSQNMKCPYCDTEFDIETAKAYASDRNSQVEDNMTWDTSAGTQWQPGEEEGLRVYSCNTCGGEIVADETTGATECPFCGNPVIMRGQFTGDVRPDLVIPFKVDKNSAIQILNNHYNGKRLLPKVFKDQNRIKEVKGLYVPVWLYDTDADAYVNYKASKIRTWSDSSYNYTETSYYSVTRAGTLGFANVPVDGSTKMDDTLMESIEPFDLGDAVDFQTAYLSGFLADKYDVNAETCAERANERIKKSTEETFASTVQGYMTSVPVTSSINLQNSRTRYALYPVWVLNTKWQDKLFTFIINGQTGKIAGDLPMDKGAFKRWLFGIAGSVAAVLYLLSFLFWML